MNVNTGKQTWKLASLEPANYELSEKYDRDVQSLDCLAQLNFNASKSFYEKIVGEFFFQLWKSDFDDFLQITGNKCI